MIFENQNKAIEAYINAKDANKPHLIKRAFTDSANLKMSVKTDSISFPADTIGRDAITELLVRNFSQSYENVYTFCVIDSFLSIQTNVRCDWLVCMTERDSGNVRVGVGQYDWGFVNEPNTLANSLLITIEQMLVLPPANYDAVMAWADGLSYPFCGVEQLLTTIPDEDALAPIRDFFNKK